jgi:hypothetical protein
MERKQVIATQSRLLQLYFIRHGETEWSLSGQHTGSTDIPLTAHGENEARELGLCLREIQFARVLTSPRQRARRTCELAGLGPAAEIALGVASLSILGHEHGHPKVRVIALWNAAPASLSGGA